jgi:hypothetical protein
MLNVNINLLQTHTPGKTTKFIKIWVGLQLPF